MEWIAVYGLAVDPSDKQGWTHCEVSFRMNRYSGPLVWCSSNMHNGAGLIVRETGIHVCTFRSAGFACVRLS
jgi:hypothetical protein